MQAGSTHTEHLATSTFRDTRHTCPHTSDVFPSKGEGFKFFIHADPSHDRANLACTSALHSPSQFVPANP